jgi:hypothetical protein
VADRVLERALAKLAEAAVEPAPPRLELAANGKPVGNAA